PPSSTLFPYTTLFRSFAYTLSITNQPTPPTEFYVLGPSGRLAEYQREVAVGGQLTVRLGIRQEPIRSGRYSVVARRDSAVLLTIPSVGPAAGEAGVRVASTAMIAPGPG